ncbi:MAG: hypothetical protein IJ527_03840 [Prevotella sp.]|nr:hypothetical protein [Prevotella sp.]
MNTMMKNMMQGLVKRLFPFCLLGFLPFCLSAFLPFHAQAQTIPDMKFRHLDTSDGLSNSQVNCIYRDSRGFVWIGTAYGLDRYDGYRIKTFLSYARDTTTLRTNRIDEVFEDNEGNLWINQGFNYSCYDPVTERFDRNPHIRLNEFGMKGIIEKLFIDSQKCFWVKTVGHGFYYYNPVTETLSHIDEGYQVDQISKNLAITSFVENKDHTVTFISSTGEVVCVDGPRGKILWRNDEISKHHPGATTYIMHVDPRGNYWVMNSSYDLYVLDAQQHLTAGLENCMALLGIDMSKMPAREIIVCDMLFEEKGFVWMSTDHFGLIVIDPRNKDVRQFINTKGDEASLNDITVKHLYQDQNGRVWIASYKNGINEYSKAQSNFIHLDLGDINAVTEDREGNWWLGTNDHGIIRYNPKTYEQTVFNRENSGFHSNVIVHAYCSKNGDLWFGTYEGGLLRYHEGHWQNYLYDGQTDGLANNNVWGITEDRKGNIWLSMLGAGFHRLDVQTGRFRTFMTSNTNLKSDWLSSIRCTYKGNILAGSSEFFAVINPNTFQIMNGEIPQDPSSSTYITHATDALWDERDLLWHGSAAGLLIHNRKTGHVTLIDMKSGLYGSKVTALTQDKKKNIWAITEHGVSNVIPQQQEDGEWTFTVRSYNSSDGLQYGPFNERAVWATSDGRILVGGQGGLDIINPLKIGEGKHQETPVFSGLRLFDYNINPGDEYEGRVILDEALDVCRELSLKYSENQFTIELASNSGEVHNRSRFYYKLEGFNDKWIRTDEKNPSVTYMSLPAGSYTLCVRMLNDDGTMGDIESQLDITIAPPFYRSWWAILFYLLLGGGLFWLWRKNFHNKFMQRLKAENLRHETEKRHIRSQVRSEMEAANSAANLQPETVTETIELQKEKADIVSFVRNLCDSFEAPAGMRASVAFNTTIESREMSFDPIMLGQALEQLMKNSVHFSPEDAQIQVSIFAPAEYDVKLLVADNGIGIKDEFKEHAFTKVDTGGYDLGLDHVKAIVEAHDGNITLADNPGGGTIFTITLPVEQQDEAEEITEAVIIED